MRAENGSVVKGDYKANILFYFDYFSGGGFFRAASLDLSSLRRIPPLNQFEEEEEERKKVFHQQLNKLKEKIPDSK